jgi:hypothetical protein
MKNDLTTGAWQHDIGCPISIILFSTSDQGNYVRMNECVQHRQEVPSPGWDGTSTGGKNWDLE